MKRKLTTTLINSLMEDLACLAVSGLGGYPEDGFSDSELFFIKTYATRTLLKICNEWEKSDIMKIEWEVVENS